MPLLKHLYSALCLSVGCLCAEDGVPFRTLFVTRSLEHERLLPFLTEARPEIVQVGNYGAMFHSHASHPKSTGTPMQLPVVGERENLAFQRKLNAKVHELGLKVVGHFRLVKAYGNWEERTGFVDYYDRHWPEDLLGPKPHPDLRELLQRDATGKPIQVSRYEKAQIAFCLSSPHARQMFKQMLELAVEHGVDGVITTYNYHLGCSCSHCRKRFRTWLDERGHLEVPFDRIPAKISGYPDPDTATELDWLAMRWAAENFKDRWDEIFVEYGRSLNPDLIVAQWNHLGHVGSGEERMFLPLEDWGKEEDYFWESGGAAFVGKNLSLRDRKAGDAWLSCLVTRELGSGKPFVMGKYDRIRLAASMAEGFATGGLGMGRYMRFEDPDGYDTLVRYTKFRNAKRHLFDGAKPVTEVGLILPRKAAWDGNVEAWDHFREMGQALCERQILLDVIPDDDVTVDRIQHLKTLILHPSTPLGKSPDLQHFLSEGGVISSSSESLATPTRITAPWTVRAALYSQPDCLVLHLVNYDRDEGRTKEERSNAPKNERPIPVENVKVDLALPAELTPTGVILHDPDRSDSLPLNFETSNGRLVFTVPRFSVYAVLEIAR